MFAPRVCFVDVETTGTDPARDRITEIGVVSVDRDGECLRVGEWSSLVNPGVPIPAEIRWLTGIRDDMVREAPRFEQLAEQLYDRFEDCVFVAHNARFDFGFIKSEFARAGIAWNARMLCTVRLSRRLYPERGSHSLDAIVARFGLDESERHRALGDARLLWRFMQRLYERLPPSCIETAIRALLVRPGLPPALAADALERIPGAPGVYVMVGAADRTLYIGKSIDMKSRVAAHFSAGDGSQRATRLAVELERIDWERTAGQIGALLRESELVKQRLPAHNIRLRRRMAQGALRLDQGRPRWVRAQSLPERDCETHYGPFGSRAAARRLLADLAREHGLCLKAMGCEGRVRSRDAESPCFNYQLQRCRGACVGVEKQEAHEQRLREALEAWRLPAWPGPGAVALRERGDAEVGDAWHVFDRWRWLGTVGSLDAASQCCGRAHAQGTVPAFDADIFQIIREALQRAERGELERFELPPAGA